VEFNILELAGVETIAMGNTFLLIVFAILGEGDYSGRP
jgi:hypothetical protein